MGLPAYRRPESVLVVVVTRGGEALLLRRTCPADFWQSVTGTLEWGETPRCAAMRELREETGLEAGVRLLDLHESRDFRILPAWRARYAPHIRYNHEHWFALLLPTRRLIRLRPDEHSGYRWRPLALARREVTSWTNRDALDRVRALLA